MKAANRIAFYAPLKPPDHPVPSGDREMARLILAALRKAGFETDIASTLRTLDATGGQDFSHEAAAEIALLLARYQARPQEKPDLWLTYHVYYKAPDLLGPAIAKAIGIPYVIVEGSRAPKRATGAWALGHAQAEAALDAADLILVPNPNDRDMLEAARPARQRLANLPPFIDAGMDGDSWPPRKRRFSPGPCRLLTVAMMRRGDKLTSYLLLTLALAMLPDDLPWHLDIIGDGPARSGVAILFQPFGNRVAFHGQIDSRKSLARYYAEADMLVWPAVNEAFGMVFLEAALQGCPAVAGNFGGVGSVVRHGSTGLLVEPGDAGVFSAAMERLMRDDALRNRFSANAYHFARNERSLPAAARRLRTALLGLIQPAKPAR